MFIASFKRSLLILALLLAACAEDRADDLVDLVNRDLGSPTSSGTGEIRGVSISVPSLTLTVGESATLTALSVDANGAQAAITDAPVWAVSNPEIANIDDTGLVTASALGSTSASVRWRGFTDEIIVTISDAAPVNLSFTPETLTFDECQSESIAAATEYSDGSLRAVPIDAIWSVSGLEGATLSPVEGGNIISSPVSGVGAVQLSQDGLSGSAVITVLDSLQSMAFDTATQPLAVGTTTNFSVNGTYSTGDVKSVNSASTWSLEHPLPDSPAASLSQLDSGEYALSALSVGSATLKVECGGLEISQELQITTAPTAVSINIVNGDVIEMAAGETVDLSTVTAFSDGHTEPVTDIVTWALLDNEDLTFILDITEPTAVKLSAAADVTFEKSATLEASYGGFVTTSQVFVLRGTPDALLAANLVAIDNLGNESILINDATLTLLAGGTLSLALNAQFQSGTIRVPATDIIWSNSSPTIANIDSAGMLTAAAPGSASVTARYQDLSITLPLVVNP